MPSQGHQRLLLWIARKMTADGFIVAGFDGTAAQAGMWNELPCPFTVNRLRPDVWGVSRRDCRIALGEAKTAADLATAHSRHQLRSFGRLIQRGENQLAKLYVAVPRSAAYALDNALIVAGLIGEPHLFRMHIPDCLVADDEV